MKAEVITIRRREVYGSEATARFMKHVGLGRWWTYRGPAPYAHRQRWHGRRPKR